MLCQNCGKNEATTHIKQIINGDMAESHLCSDCAAHLGYSDMFSGFGLNLSGLFSGLLGDMMPSIQRIHGKIKHSGKVTNAAPVEPREETTEEKIEKLKAAMNEAVAKQEFENAAKIRDEIKALEGGESK